MFAFSFVPFEVIQSSKMPILEEMVKVGSNKNEISILYLNVVCHASLEDTP